MTIKIKYKNIEYELSKIEVNHGIEKNLKDDLEFSCKETKQHMRIKYAMYRELANINLIIANDENKTKYHIETLLTHAIVNNMTSDIYKRAYNVYK